MSKGQKKRESIYHRYSANLNNYFESIGQQLLWVENGAVSVKNDAYICPLCYEVFFAHHLIESPTDNFLTLEHNPPKCMGGPKAVLTCKKCNNKNGAEYDDLVKKLLVTESFLYSNQSSLDARFTINGHSIGGRIIKAGTKKGVAPNPNSNPRAYQELSDAISAGKPINIEHTLTSPDWKDYSMGMLKMAYLKAFELFGYHFADFGNGANIRAVLHGEAMYPTINNGVIDIFASEDYVGVNVVVEPKELKALVITLPLHFKHDRNIVKKNVPVILPAPFEGGWEMLSNYNNYVNKMVAYKTARYTIPTKPLPYNRDYHLMFSDRLA